MGNKHIVMFSADQIALHKEIPHHPTLVERLQNHPADEYEVRLAEIANYCNIVLHGDYTPDDLDKLCGVLADKLRVKRLGLAFPQDPALVSITDEPKIIH